MLPPHPYVSEQSLSTKDAYLAGMAAYATSQLFIPYCPVVDGVEFPVHPTVLASEGACPTPHLLLHATPTPPFLRSHRTHFQLLWLSIPSEFLVVFEKPNRSLFTFTFTLTLTFTSQSCRGVVWQSYCDDYCFVGDVAQSLRGQ